MRLSRDDIRPPLLLALGFLLLASPSARAAAARDGFDQDAPDPATAGGQARLEIKRWETYFQTKFFDGGRSVSEMRGTGFAPFSRARWFWESRADHTGAIRNDELWRRFLESKQRLLAKSTAVPAAQWTTLGPSTMSNLGGRMLCYAFHPARPETIYAGANSGGLWRTTNGGDDWLPLTDQIPAMTVSAIAVNPSAPNEMLIGTGWGWFVALTGYSGVGVLRSTDGGLTWDPTSLAYPQSAGVGIYDVVWDPLDASRVHIAANNGVYRSTDGGLTWGLSRSGDCTALVIHPTNSSILYAAFQGGGLFRSTDAGATYLPFGSGLPPAATIQQTSLAICRDVPNTLYTIVTDAATFGMKGLYKSTSGGALWTQVTSIEDVLCQPMSTTNCIGWLFNAISVAPDNPDHVIAAGVRVGRSTDGGATWVYRDAVSNGLLAPGVIYVDSFAFGWHPTNAGVVYGFNDGGVFKSTDAGLNWEPKSSGLQTALLYNIASAATDPDFVVAGTQDHGIQKLDHSGGNLAWTRWTSGEGGPANIDFVSEQVVYGVVNSGTHVKSFNGASTYDEPPNMINVGITEPGRFLAPTVMNPLDRRVLWTASTQKIYKTTNRGALWVPQSNIPNVVTIAIDHVDPSVVYAHAYDQSTWQLWRTTDAGAAWTQLTDASIPAWRVTDLEADPTIGGVVYATRNSAFAGNDHVKRSTDWGVTWSDATGDLPDVPTNAIAISPFAPEHLYVATDLGVYLTTNGGVNWNEWNDGMPVAYASDIHYRPQDRTLRVATIGRGAWKSLAFDAIVTAVPAEPPAAPGSPGASDALRIGAAPNPFSESTRIAFDISHRSAVEVAIFNASGQRVAELLDAPRDAGRHELDWNGCDANGRRVRAGVYFARITAGGLAHATRITVL